MKMSRTPAASAFRRAGSSSSPCDSSRAAGGHHQAAGQQGRDGPEYPLKITAPFRVPGWHHSHLGVNQAECMNLRAISRLMRLRDTSLYQFQG